MKTSHLLEQLQFDDHRAHAEPLLADHNNRIIRFMLKPKQKVKEHQVSSSTVILVVQKGRGLFYGKNGDVQELGPHGLVIYEPGEAHTIEALDQELVFIAILKQAPASPTEKAVGALA